MEGKAYLTEEEAYKSLQQYYNENGSKINILEMFKNDSNRFQKYRLVNSLNKEFQLRKIIIKKYF